MATSLLPTPELFMAALTGAGIGCAVPSIADGILRSSRERYRQGLHDALDEYVSFYSEMHRAPNAKARGRERALSRWAAELPRLAADGMLSRHELLTISASSTPLPISVTPDLLQRAPSEEDLAKEFSLTPQPSLMAASGAVIGTAAAIIVAHAGMEPASALAILFVAACWLMAVIDVRSRTIPSACTALIAASGIAWRAAAAPEGIAVSLGMAVFSYAALRALNFVSERTRGQPGIGGGDVRALPVVIGVLGPPGAAIGLIATSVALVVYMLARMAAGSFRLDEKIPFGPFIAMAGAAGVLSLTVA